MTRSLLVLLLGIFFTGLTTAATPLTVSFTVLSPENGPTTPPPGPGPRLTIEQAQAIALNKWAETSKKHPPRDEVGLNDFPISEAGPPGNFFYGAFDPAIAYNSTTNEYLVIWRGNDTDDASLDILGQRIDAATGAEVGADDFRISDMGPDGQLNFAAFDPAVTYNSSTNEYLVVWVGDDNVAPLVDDEVEVFGQRLSATGAEIGPNDFRISNMTADGVSGFSLTASSPAVIYNTTANEYLVVWTGKDNDLPLAGIEIFGQRLNATGGEIGPNDFRISDMGAEGSFLIQPGQPALAYNSQSNEYLVLWESDDDTSPLVMGEREIFGQRLTSTGNEIGSNDFRISDMGPDGDTNFAASTPVVAYNSAANEYLVVWAGDDNTLPLVDDEQEIFGQRLNATGTEVGANDFRLSDMGPDGDDTFEAFSPAITYNSTANEYMVVWGGDDNIPPLVDDEEEIFGQRLASDGTEQGDNDFRLSDIGPDGNTAYAIFPPVGVAYSSLTNEYLVVWSSDNDTPEQGQGEYEILGQRFKEPVQPGLYFPLLNKN